MSITDAFSSETDDWDIYKYSSQYTCYSNKCEATNEIETRVNLVARVILFNDQNLQSQMSKAPQGEVEISGGADSRGDYWVEGKIAFKFGGDKEGKAEDSKDKEHDPPDTRDRVSND